MAFQTKIFTTLDPYTDAAIQYWTQEWEDCILDTGWARVSQTGEANLATITVPLDANPRPYWRCYRSNDADANKQEIFLKVSYGKAINAASYWAAGFDAQIGWGLDGNGNFIGPATDRLVAGMSNGGTSNLPVYSAGQSGWLSIHVSGGSYHRMGLSIERVHDDDGVQRNAVHLHTTHVFPSYCQCIEPHKAHRFTMNEGNDSTGIQLVNLGLNSGTTVIGGDIAVASTHTDRGIISTPLINMFTMKGTDMGAPGSVVAIESYGVNHNYVVVNGIFVDGSYFLSRYE